MTNLIIKMLSKKHGDISAPDARLKAGNAAGTVGMLCNFLLVVLKLVAGIAAGFTAWRHGGDSSYTVSGKYDVQLYNGSGANAVFYDGHAETVLRERVEAIGQNPWFQNGILYLDGVAVE